MTNYDKWKSYTSGIASPENYIQFGWYYLIAAALQRRVWCPPEHRKLYPNIYITLVGKPGIGKGQLIRFVSDLLTQHKLEDVQKAEAPAGTADEAAVVEAIQQADLRAAQDEMAQGKHKDASIDKPLLIPVAADAVTYEALVQSMSRCLRRINYKEFSETQQKEVMKIYSHSSLCFCLEEIASLFRKNTESLVNFLIQAYDCGESYEYVTKTQGRDRIRRVCLNFFGGTNPDFMQDTFDDKLLSQGYSSRTFYIFANKNRKSVFFMPELTVEQRQYRDDISQHVKALSKLYGQVKLESGTMSFLENWWSKYEQNPQLRASQSRKLEAYYSRKNIHVMKIAMAMHFGESLDMCIPQSRFEEAIEVLAVEEKQMHMALTFEADNPLAKTTRLVVEYLRSAGPKNFMELLTEFWGKVRQSELEEVLDYLQKSDQVITDQKEEEGTGKPFLYYKVK